MRVVAITGASAGIGRATAVWLARDGAAVAICARRADRLDAVAAEIVAAGGQALPIVADVTRGGDMDQFVARAVETFGRLDVMICNAGFGVAGAIDQVPPAQMQKLVDINYTGTYHAARAALPLFRRQNSGHLIIVSSIVGKRGVPYMGAYAATKFAQVGLAECLRAELAGTPIHVSGRVPGLDRHRVLRRDGRRDRRGGRPRVRAAAARRTRLPTAIARAIDRPVAEVYPHAMSRGLAIFNALAPAWCDRFVQRFGRKPAR